MAHSLSRIAAGLAGALALTALHETLRTRMAQPPRMDLIGMRAIDRSLKAAGLRTPRRRELRQLALGGDLVSNTLYYAAGTGGGRPLVRGALAGLIAGLGALFLPHELGIGERPRSVPLSTALATVGVYTAGGIAAGLVARLLKRRAARSTHDVQLFAPQPPAVELEATDALRARPEGAPGLP